MDHKTFLHNELSGRFVDEILRPLAKQAESPEEILVLLESCMVGAFMAFVKVGGDEAVFDKLVEGIKERIDEARRDGDLYPRRPH